VAFESDLAEVSEDPSWLSEKSRGEISELLQRATGLIKNRETGAPKFNAFHSDI
jgi:hypothetical protein